MIHTTVELKRLVRFNLTYNYCNLFIMYLSVYCKIVLLSRKKNVSTFQKMNHQVLASLFYAMDENTVLNIIIVIIVWREKSQ